MCVYICDMFTLSCVPLPKGQVCTNIRSLLPTPLYDTELKCAFHLMCCHKDKLHTLMMLTFDMNDLTTMGDFVSPCNDDCMLFAKSLTEVLVWL